MMRAIKWVSLCVKEIGIGSVHTIIEAHCSRYIITRKLT